MSDGLTLLAELVEHLLLTALPIMAGALAAVRLGVRSVPVLLAIGVLTSGAVAMLAFWLFYAAPLAGESFAYLALFGSILLVAWVLLGGRPEGALLRALAAPMAMWILGSAFLLFLGFAHGGMDSPVSTASIRFSSPLPSDNDIPKFFADWFFNNGHDGRPPPYPGDWLSSDRPPLQEGYVLSQRPFFWDETGLRYQTLGVALQQLWIVGLWALLLAARVGRVTRALAMIAVLTSGLVIVNGFFVWPKLLPAAMLLAAAALILTPLWPTVRRERWGGAMIAGLLGLALLGHGSSVFGAVPLLLVAGFRGLPNPRWIGIGALIGFLLLAPWLAYQKHEDPPGNRLNKWFLAGVVDIDGRGTGEAVVDSYRDAGIGGTLDNKLDNFEAMVGGANMVERVGNSVDAARSGRLDGSIRELRLVVFFYLLPSLGLFVLAPLVMALGRHRAKRNPTEWRFALACLVVLAVGAVFWGLVLFGGPDATTVIHQGSYLLPILGLCGAVAGLRAVSPRVGLAAVSGCALLSLALYVPALDQPPETSYSALFLAVAAVAIVAFGAICLFLSGRASETKNRLAEK